MRVESKEEIFDYHEYKICRFSNKHKAVVKVIVPTKTKSETELEKVSRLYLQWWQETHSSHQRKPWGYQHGKWKLCQNPGCSNAFYVPSSMRRTKGSFYCAFSCWNQNERQKPFIWSDEKIAETMFQIQRSKGEITPNFLMKKTPGMYHRLYRKWKQGEVNSIQDAIDKITFLSKFSEWPDSQKIRWFLDGAYYQSVLFFEQLNFLTKKDPAIISHIGRILKEKGVFGPFFSKTNEILKNFFESENEKELKNFILEVWQGNKMGSRQGI